MTTPSFEERRNAEIARLKAECEVRVANEKADYELKKLELKSRMEAVTESKTELLWLTGLFDDGWRQIAEAYREGYDSGIAHAIPAGLVERFEDAVLEDIDVRFDLDHLEDYDCHLEIRNEYSDRIRWLQEEATVAEFDNYIARELAERAPGYGDAVEAAEKATYDDLKRQFGYFRDWFVLDRAIDAVMNEHNRCGDCELLLRDADLLRKLGEAGEADWLIASVKEDGVSADGFATYFGLFSDKVAQSIADDVAQKWLMWLHAGLPKLVRNLVMVGTDHAKACLLLLGTAFADKLLESSVVDEFLKDTSPEVVEKARTLLDEALLRVEVGHMNGTDLDAFVASIAAPRTLAKALPVVHPHPMLGIAA